MKSICALVLLLAVLGTVVAVEGADLQQPAVVEQPAKPAGMIELDLAGGWINGKVKSRGLEEDQRKDLTLRLYRRGERCTTGWALTAPGAHKAQSLLPDLTCTDSAISGTVRRWQLNNRAYDAELWTIDATVSGDRITGSYRCHRLHDPSNPEKGGIDYEGSLTGRVLDSAALDQAYADNGLADGADWPCFLGPESNGRAAASDRPMIDAWKDARLVWRAELQCYPGSPGSGHPGCGGTRTDYDGPIVGDGKVFFCYMEPDVDGPIIEMPRHKAHILKQVDGERIYPYVASLLVNDVCHAFDARTGALLWRTEFPRRGANGNLPMGTCGHWSTPVYADGRVYWCGSNGRVYCLDAETGAVHWELVLQPELIEHFAAEVAKVWDAPKGEGRRVPLGNYHYHVQASPCLADGVLVCSARGLFKQFRSGLYGVDAQTGKILWGPIANVHKFASPTVWRHDGKDYVITAEVRCIDPKNGTVLWEYDRLVGHRWYGAIVDDLYLPRSNGLMGKKEVNSGAICGPILRLRPDGCEVVAAIPDGTGSAQQAKVGSTWDGAGHFFYVTGKGLYAITADGTQVSASPGEHPTKSLGYGNLGYMGGLIVAPGTNGGMWMWSWDREAKSLSNLGRNKGGIDYYWCSVPALADGRLFIRTTDSLACFDLRQPAR